MKLFNDFKVLLERLLVVYGLFFGCRILFYAFNATLIGPISEGEWGGIIRGALLFDSASIFYINFPFLIVSLLPFRFRAARGYQQVLAWLFVTMNTLGLLLNLADVFYYPYKLARIASDDLHFTTDGNFGLLFGRFLSDYWYGFLILGITVWVLWYAFRHIPYRASQARNGLIYYASQGTLLGIGILLALFCIRGFTLSPATFPINISDASRYAAPEKVGLVVSNPFALIRTLGQRGKISCPHYFEESELDAIFTPVQERIEGDTLQATATPRPNIVLIILESFGSANLKSLSDVFPASEPSYTPFLDSLFTQGLLFTNAYQTGLRSIDALPSLWASIPSFKSQFLSLPQSAAPIEGLPILLKSEGYTSAFLHGAVKPSMSFVAFGSAVGVEHFWNREEYEKDCGSADFDGHWGIWDDKFLPYAAEQIGTLKQPFFATIFTLSSHHPFLLPPQFEGKFPMGTEPIHRTIAYTDFVLRAFFEKIKSENWFAHTIFVITADHRSNSEVPKYQKVPYNYAIPLFFYAPDSTWGKRLHGADNRPAQQLDLKPTLLHLLDYQKPFFAFGQDLLQEEKKPRYAVNYFGGSFNTITDSLVYVFNEKELVGVYNYRRDPLQTQNLRSETFATDSVMRRTKGFIQQYYRHIKERRFK